MNVRWSFAPRFSASITSMVEALTTYIGYAW